MSKDNLGLEGQAATLPTSLQRAWAATQRPIFGPPLTYAVSLEFDAAGDRAALQECLRGLRPDDAVLGIGAPLAGLLGWAAAGLRTFEPIGDAVRGFVSTQHALWALVPGDSHGAAFDAAEALIARLAPVFRLADANALFRYRDGRDLTGFRDGTANPVGADAAAAALVGEGPLAGASFALVQRFVHRRERFAALARESQERVIGRSLDADLELADAPVTAHVKRTEQESYEPPAFMLRRSMPWGTPLRGGLQFIAFMSDLARARAMLRRMAGLGDGIADALLDYTQAETGAYYLCPPLSQRAIDVAALQAC